MGVMGLFATNSKLENKFIAICEHGLINLRSSEV